MRVYPEVVRSWEERIEELMSYLKYPYELRAMIYTTGKIVLVEIQTTFDKSLYLRMIDVYLRVIEKYAEYPIVILLWVVEKKSPYRESVNLGALRFKFTIKDLKKINCKELLESDDPYDVLLSMLCKRGKDFWSKLREKVFLLPEEKRAEFIMKAGILARLRSDLIL